MSEYKSNSFSKPAAPTINHVAEPVVKAVKRKKRSELSKIISTFMPMDPSEFRDYAFHNILIPYAKKIVQDAVDVALNGEISSGKKKTGSLGAVYDYGGCYESSKKKASPVTAKRQYHYDDIILGSARDAERVLAQMKAMLENYDWVTIGTFFELVSELPSSSDYNFGWSNLDRAEIKPVRGGWIIDFPTPKPVDKD